MQSLGCSVDTDEITTTQSEVNNLSAQSENNAAWREADSLISDIQTTDPSDTVAWQSILDRYDDFISRDQNFNNLKQSGVYNQYFNPQGDAQTKLTTVISENNAVSA